MDPANATERRQHDRFSLPAMYTTITVQRAPGMRMQRLEGHAYDVSEGGVRLELDESLAPGERVAVHLGLPGEETPVFVSGQVVWTNDEDDDPGPRRSAVCFSDFLSETDRRRLIRFLGSGLGHRAA